MEKEDPDWHEQKSIHNYNACKYLGLKSPEYQDWEVITAFYSACKLVDAYFLRRHHKKPSNHTERNRMVETKLPDIAYEYKTLYDLGRSTRYDKDVPPTGRDDAMACHKAIVDYLSGR